MAKMMRLLSHWPDFLSAWKVAIVPLRLPHLTLLLPFAHHQASLIFLGAQFLPSREKPSGQLIGPSERYALALSIRGGRPPSSRYRSHIFSAADTKRRSRTRKNRCKPSRALAFLTWRSPPLSRNI